MSVVFSPSLGASTDEPVFSGNPSASAQTLRRVAARNLNLSDQMEHGTVEEYANLSRDDQVRLTDEMARLIVMYPAGWSAEIVAEANRRTANPYYGRPLDNESYSSNLITTIGNGSFFGAAFGGAVSYLVGIGLIAGAALLVMEYSKRK